MKAIFAVPMENANAVLPPMEDLHYVNDKVIHGGYSLVGQVPQRGINSVLVLVDSSAETLRAMYADPAYLWIERVAEIAVEAVPAEVPVERRT